MTTYAPFKLSSHVRNIFIPSHQPPCGHKIKELTRILRDISKLFVLTGAGISTESGIPDYRSKDVGRYARTNHRPVQFQEFIKNEHVRKRYWARNYVSWPKFGCVQPNDNHTILAEWERKGKIHTIVTQNVDRLHEKAGSKSVIELHGSGFTVSCLKCKHRVDRHWLQDQISTLNPSFLSDESLEMAPDGDTDISKDLEDSFNPPLCNICQGAMMPDIVFFGDNVTSEVKEACFNALDRSDAILVAGSSLHVYSGYRFVKAAHDQGKKVLILNIGETRADHLATLKLDCRCSHVLKEIQF